MDYPEEHTESVATVWPPPIPYDAPPLPKPRNKWEGIAKLRWFYTPGALVWLLLSGVSNWKNKTMPHPAPGVSYPTLGFLVDFVLFSVLAVWSWLIYAHLRRKTKSGQTQ